MIKKKATNKTNQKTVDSEAVEILDEVNREIKKVAQVKRPKYTWMIPLLVIMVVGATIYLSIIERKTEYVYSLATACFGYYFGNFTATKIQTPQSTKKPINGAEDIIE